MKRLTILRDNTSDQGTFGVGTVREDGDSLFRCEWVELPWRDNAAGLSCVPAGIVYTAHIVQSTHFGRAVYLLDNVPGRDLIEVHPANWAGDRAKGWHSDLRGCCAPGLARAVMAPEEHGVRMAPQAAVTSSSHTLDLFMDATRQERIEITFLWAPGIDPARRA